MCENQLRERGREREREGIVSSVLHWAAGENTTQRTLVEDETMRHDPYWKGYVGTRG